MPARRPVWWWVVFTFVLLLVLQTAVPLYIIFSEGLASGFDWAGFTGFTLGYIAGPLLFGCLGLLWRGRRGLGFCLVALGVFFALQGAGIVASVIA
jgi:hypothetical protein